MSTLEQIRDELLKRLSQPTFVFVFGDDSTIDVPPDFDRVVARVHSTILWGASCRLAGPIESAARKAARPFALLEPDLDADGLTPIDLRISSVPRPLTNASSENERHNIVSLLLRGTLRPARTKLPIYIFAGTKQEQTTFFVKILAEADVTAPILLVASEISEDLASLVPRYDGWPSLAQDVATMGYRLDTSDSKPRIRLRARKRSTTTSDAPVDRNETVFVGLDEVVTLRDASARLDDCFRLITEKALGRPDAAPDVERRMFKALLDLDEERDAIRAEDDLLEWWAIGEKFALGREPFDEVLNRVLAELGTADSQARARSLWLPVEPGAGTTVFLHQLAYAVAQEGHPVLVLRQATTHFDPERAHDFLFGVKDSLHRRQYMEVPALVVADAHHTSESIDAFLQLAAQVHSRQIVVLRATPVSVAPIGGTVDSTKVRRGIRRRGQENLPTLRADVSETLIERMASHVAELRRTRPLLGVGERSKETFVRFHEETAKNVGSQDPSLAGAVFFALLFHFLTTTDDDPVQGAFARRLDRMESENRDSAKDPGFFRALDTVAACSCLGIAIPVGILSDWVLSGIKADGASLGASEPSPSPITLAERLRTAWASPGWQVDTSEAQTWALIEELRERGWIRVGQDEGENLVWFFHTALARQYLLARRRRDSALDANLGDLIDQPDTLGFRFFKPLLAGLRTRSSAVRFAEDVSYRVLQGSDVGPWRAEPQQQSGRIASYECIPRHVFRSSRTLHHHHALVLRRSCFGDLDPRTKAERLRKAAELLNEGMELPLRYRARDDHPGHMLTSLGFVLRSLASTAAPAETALVRQQAIEAFRRAIREVTLRESPATALGLAEALLEDAREARSADISLAAGHGAEVLKLLSSAHPDARYESRWREAVKGAEQLFVGDFSASLQRALDDGNESAVLFEVERLLMRDQHKDAIVTLQRLVEPSVAYQHPRACRRMCDFLRSGQPENHDLRYRLLCVLEAHGDVVPVEAYELAFLSYVIGEYRRGGDRFDAMRRSGTSLKVAGVDDYLYRRGEKRVQQFSGRVKALVPRPTVEVFSAHQSLGFWIPFDPEKFGRPAVGAAISDLGIRFSGMGPKALRWREVPSHLKV